MTTYRIIVGHSVDALMINVNFAISTLDGAYEFIGPPQMFGHSEFIQAIEVYTK